MLYVYSGEMRAVQRLPRVCCLPMYITPIYGTLCRIAVSMGIISPVSTFSTGG